MKPTPVYHKLPRSSLASVLKHGLRYGVQGRHGQEPHAIKTNTFLDDYCPPEFAAKGLSRKHCLYGYLYLADRLIDVDTGRPLSLQEWRVSEDYVRLALYVDPAVSYIGDLEAYDQLAAALEHDTALAECQALARQYWCTLLPLSTVRAEYQPGKQGIVPRTTHGSSQLQHYKRVEVLLTRSVEPACIKQL